MDNETWKKFIKARKKFHSAVEEINAALPNLRAIQQEFADNRGYTVETPVVYNTALDDITQDDEIKLILVADNPGRREQEKKRYLVGPSGKIAGKFFCDNPALGIDFSKNVIILNKTPIHTPRTADLRALGGSAVLEESQRMMARLLADFFQALGAQIWITGYSEMKKGGIFAVYTDVLRDLLIKNKLPLLVFRHFSMNQFTVDLKRKSQYASIQKNLYTIGSAYRKRILGL
jgi:hypothetical protein